MQLQATKLTGKLSMPLLMMGDMLRTAVKKGTEWGLKAKAMMETGDAGTVVPLPEAVSALQASHSPTRF